MSVKLEILTVSNKKPSEWYYCHDEHFKSAALYGFEVKNICQEGEYKGLISKPKILKRYMEQNNITADLLLFVDCWDTLFLDDPAKTIPVWERGGEEILFNAEKNLFPRGDLLNNYPSMGTPYRFLNSGVFIGATGSVYRMLKEMNLDSIPDDYRKPDGSMHHENDQAYFQEWFVNTKMTVALDHQCELCQTLHDTGVEEVAVVEGPRLKNYTTGTFPILAHANGGGKDGPIMPELLNQWRLKHPG